MPDPLPLTFTNLNPKKHGYAPTPSSLSRAKIPGGWLVYATSSGDAASLVFVPELLRGGVRLARMLNDIYER